MGNRRLGEPFTLLLAVAACLFLFHAVTWRGYLIDDAYISLRYASHLADGNGLVWNVGERVEGYTNFLWVWIGAAFLRFGVAAMAALQTVSALATLATLALTARLARLTGGPGPVSAMIWLLAAESFGYYATTGMETALFTTLVVAALVLGLDEARDSHWRGSVVVFLLLTLTRPEGALLFVVCQGLFAIVERRRQGHWILRRRVLDAGVYALGVGVWIGWRLAYYGEWLPNTLHAKVTGGSEQLASGLLTLGTWSLSYPIFALTLLAPALLWAPRYRQRKIVSPEFLAVWALALVWAFYVVTVGGDTMPFHRFLVPLLPLVAVLTSRFAGDRLRDLALAATESPVPCGRHPSFRRASGCRASL